MFIYNSTQKYEEYSQKSEIYLKIDSYFNEYAESLNEISTAIKSKELTKEQFTELDKKGDKLISGYNDYVSKFSMDDCVRYQFDINNAYYLTSFTLENIQLLSDDYSKQRELKKDNSAQAKLELKKLENTISTRETEVLYGKNNLYVGKYLYHSKIIKNLNNWLVLKIVSYVILAIGLAASVYSIIVLVRYIKLKMKIRKKSSSDDNPEPENSEEKTGEEDVNSQ